MNDRGIEYLIGINGEHARAYNQPEEVMRRREFREKYPVEILVTECMDGRVHLPVFTKTPGVIQSYRNLGGVFRLGWHLFQNEILRWKKYARSQRRICIVLNAYHYSEGLKERGCRRFHFEVEQARADARRLQTEFSHDFNCGELFAFLVGIETDCDALVFHGNDGTVFNLAEWEGMSEERALQRIQCMYEDVARSAPAVIRALHVLVMGNLAHIHDVRASRRTPIDVDHRESVLAIGGGLDWLRVPNLALIVGPWNDQLSVPIHTATRIIQDNLASGRIGNRKIVLLASGAYRGDEGADPAAPLLAIRKAKYLRDQALAVMREFPDVRERLDVLTTTIDYATRAMTIIEDE